MQRVGFLFVGGVAFIYRIYQLSMGFRFNLLLLDKAEDCQHPQNTLVVRTGNPNLPLGLD